MEKQKREEGGEEEDEDEAFRYETEESDSEAMRTGLARNETAASSRHHSQMKQLHQPFLN
eukprot:CAMPEP_0206469340 /NCGR_PEP_ID=MMETSP0324_2-20121206/30213_1 /ASSEMBLY_ACC=CAM_ASM_000836 /TAXON_ID=2866 /ORGANISM="Crypthecodinium cohnii, Strain Seligo" /LENGTH=59 /DNA_ID=CAMNT_0053943063 /DNA_START=283 /DNA_END=462 /DNA_ORIENTATION=+